MGLVFTGKHESYGTCIYSKNGKLHDILWWVVGSILHGGLSELFFIPASAPQLLYQRLWYVLSCLWNGAYTKNLAANRKE